MPSTPSPFQSPQTAVSPARPAVKLRASPPVRLSRTYQVPLRNTACVSTPSPFQSQASTWSPT